MPAFVTTAVSFFEVIFFGKNEKAVFHIKVTLLYFDLFCAHKIETGFLFLFIPIVSLLLR